MASGNCHCFQIIDHFADHIEARLPEIGIGHIDARFFQNLLRPRRTAARQQFQITRLEGIALQLIAPEEERTRSWPKL